MDYPITERMLREMFEEAEKMYEPFYRCDHENSKYLGVPGEFEPPVYYCRECGFFYTIEKNGEKDPFDPMISYNEIFGW